MWSLENGTDDLSAKRETETEQMYGHQGGRKWGWDGLGGWDWHVYTSNTMYKIESTVDLRGICPGFCGDLNGKEIPRGAKDPKIS